MEKGYCQITDKEPRPEMLYEFLNGKVFRKCVFSSDIIVYYKRNYELSKPIQKVTDEPKEIENKDEIETNQVKDVLTHYCITCRFADGEWHEENGLVIPKE